MNKSTLGLANRAVATINIKGSCKKGNGRFFSVSACRKPGQAVHGSHTEYRFRCIKREFHEAKCFALLEVKYPV